jgi:RHS repeat-associated protein
VELLQVHHTGNPCNLGTISVRLYADGSTDGLPTALYSASDTAWGEGTITWNNKPPISSSALSEAIVNNAAGYYVWDVTSYVRSEYLAGRSTVTLVAKGPASPPASSEKVTIAGRSSTTPPQLVVNTEPLVPGCTSTAAPLADTFTRSSSPDQNFGGRNELEVKFPGSSTWSYVKVPLPAVASGAVASAKLRFRGKADNAGAVVSLYGVSDTTWGESTLTWTNKPAPDASALGNLPVSDASTQWYEWNLTDYVQARILAGHSAATFALQINANQSVAFDSRESNHGPVFIVDVGVPIYYIHVDHLNTPRLVANQSGQAVWRWDQQEPFGVSVPDENPSGLGIFEQPLRFPGQYFDKETNLHYNYFRDYDPSIGRYAESDPVGLHGGINTYSYVGSAPLAFIDPLGLQAIPAPLYPPIAGPNSGSSGNIARALNNLWKKIRDACFAKDDDADCERASSYHLKAAEITDEHAFKAGYVGNKGVSRFDICACKDGTIKLSQAGQCGRSGPKIDTHARWR